MIVTGSVCTGCRAIEEQHQEGIKQIGGVTAGHRILTGVGWVVATYDFVCFGGFGLCTSKIASDIGVV